MSDRKLHIETPGLVPYVEGLEMQRKRVDAVRAGAAPETLFLLEHPPVITLGRSARREHVLADAEMLVARGIGVHEAARGGDVTLHAPGQLVGYLVCDLASRGVPDVSRWLRGIETALIAALEDCGTAGGSCPGRTGVFIAGTSRKIASIGVGLRGWTTFHGFALNVTNDLSLFDCIVACGLRDVTMTSLARERGPAGHTESGAALFAAAQGAVVAAFRGWLD